MDSLFRIICIIYAIYAVRVITHPTKMIPFLAVSWTIDAFRQAYVFSGAVISTGITIYSYDLPIIVMFAVMVLWKRERYTPRTILPLIVVLLTIVGSMVSGLNKYGMNLYYLTDVRIFLSLIIPIFYFIMYPVSFEEEDIRAIKNNLNILLGYSYFTWALRLTTGINLVPNEVQGGFRVFGSTTTFIMAAIALYLIYYEVFVGDNKKISAQTILTTVAVIIMQHNSVWAAFIVGLVLIIILSWIERPDRNIGYIYNVKAFKQIIILVIFTTVVLFVWKDNPIMNAISGSLDKYSQFGTGEGTIGSRQTIWAAYISLLENKLQWLMGQPFGSGWFVNYRGAQMFAPPHNAYVEGVMRIGLVGTIVLFGTLLHTAISALLKRRVIIFALFVSSFVYLYAYMFSWQMSSLWGILIGMTLTLQPVYSEEVDEIDEIKY
ncbi:hypothetical protein [Ruminococcus sp. 5_1_39BFAA]|uniref:hypothetical protein n=1 Tax=Ruminococcus sp. 5_1_39BFAA TaxID=457412 RepID=UPI003562988E